MNSSTMIPDRPDRIALKRIVFGAFALAHFLPLIAQEGFQVGVKTLPGWAWFLNEDDEGNAGFGWSYGLGANYHFNDGMGVGVDVIWSDEEQVISIDGIEVKNTLSFLKVPILLHFNSDPSEHVPFLGYFGFQFTSLRGAESEVGGQTNEDAEEFFRDSNMGVVVGLGPGWNISENLQFTAILRADYLFNDPEDKDAGSYPDDRPRTSLVTFGIDIGLKVIFGGSGG